MSAINSSLLPAVATETLEAFTVDQVVLTLADTEYTKALPAGTKSFMLQNRNNGLVKFKSAALGNYWTLFPGQPYWIHNIKASASVTIYLESTSANQIVELISWT